MRVHVFEIDDSNSTPTFWLGPVRDVDLGQEGASPRQILDLLRSQFPGVRSLAYNGLDKKLPGWEEVTEANAGNLPAFLAHRKQFKAVPAISCHNAYVGKRNWQRDSRDEDEEPRCHCNQTGPDLCPWAEPDPSTDIAIRLVSDGPSDLPKLEELAKLLQKPLPVQLTATYVDVVLIGTLLALGRALPQSQRLYVDLQREKADSNFKMVSKAESGHSLPPDLVLREASTWRLLFKGEERGVDHYLKDAVADLTRKTARSSEYYNCGLDYLLSYAAAGRFLQFFALLGGSVITPVEISPVYDLTLPDDWASLVLVTINLYTLLAAVQRSLPCYVLPAGWEMLSREDPRGFKRAL
ncbi:g3239 [Coccomyxa elongata]